MTADGYDRWVVWRNPLDELKKIVDNKALLDEKLIDRAELRKIIMLRFLEQMKY